MSDFPEGARVRVGNHLGVVHRDTRTIVVRMDSGEFGYFEPSFVQVRDDEESSDPAKPTLAARYEGDLQAVVAG